MSENNIREKTLSNFLWRLGERFLAQIISFIVSIVLARILEPDAYGTCALVLAFTSILQIFVDSGLGNALIQKKDADDIDFSTVFYFNVILCLTLYSALFFISPLVEEFYEGKNICLLLRVLGLIIVISGVKNIQQAYVSRTLQFRKFFWATLGGTITSAVVGIIMALMGFGVWSLVAQYLSNLLIDTVVLWITVQWRPKRVFDRHRLKGLLSYGWKLLVSGVIDSVYGNLCQLIIGRLYSTAELAYYDRGNKFPNVIVANVNSSIDSVLLPIMSKEQENVNRVKSITRRSIRTAVYIMAPMMVGLCVIADNVVSVILTDKWLLCVPYLRIFCISYMFMPIHTSNLNAIKALGRSDVFLKLEIIKKVVGLTIIFISSRISVLAIAYGMIIINVISQIVNAWPNNRLLGYSYLSQLRDILPSIMLSLFMGVLILPLSNLPLNKAIILLIQIISGMIIYVVGSVITKQEEFFYLKDVLKSLISRK